MKKDYKIFSVKGIFYLMHGNGIGWFRVLNGYGMQWKDASRYRPLFSERNGYRKVIKIGKYSIRILKP